MAQEEKRSLKKQEKQLLVSREQIQPKKGMIYLYCFFIMDSIFNENYCFALIAQALTEFLFSCQL